jgi:hypothetical protein
MVAAMKESSVDKWMFSGKVRVTRGYRRADRAGTAQGGQRGRSRNKKVGAKDVQCVVVRRKAGLEEEQRMVG